MIREVIQGKLEKALKALGVEDVPVSLEFPGELSHGDYASNMALVAAKALGLSPHETAEKIVAALDTIEGVEKIEIAGPGFINFHLSRQTFISSIAEILSAGEQWGKNDHVKGYKAAIEYTSPNLFKPIHIGNLMSNIIGESLARLTEGSGAEVKRINYPSDIGLTVAKGVWGVMKNKLDPKNINDLGKAYVAGNTAYEEDIVAKKEIEEINKKLYEGDRELNKIREAGVTTSKKHLEELCRVLGTQFDIEFFESETAAKGVALVRSHIGSVFEESDGAVIFPGEKYGLHTRVFLNSLGLPTYEAKDLALAKMKHDAFPFDFSVTTTANEQNDYFKVIFKAIELVFPELKGKLMHVGYGFLTLTTGKMSSRKGNVITGESLIADMREKALAKMEGREFISETEKKEVADAVAVAAIKFNVLKQGTGKNIIFDPEKSLSFEGDSGPYLQYSYVRAVSVLNKAGTWNLEPGTLVPSEVPEFERLLPRFPDVVFRAAKEYEPHYVTTYLTQLAGAFNSWYAAERVIGSEHESYKLALVQAFAQTMKNGLWLLGIKAPEHM